MAASGLMIGRYQTYRPSLLARVFLSESWKLVLSASSSDRIRLQLAVDIDLRCLDVVEISSSKALLWHRVEIRSKGRFDALSGLTAKMAQTLLSDLQAFVNNHLVQLIASDKERLLEVDTKIRALTDSNQQYLAHGDVSRAIASVPGDASLALAHPMFDAKLIPARLRDYGVPSRVEDDELLNLVIPRPETFAYAEERRLFYVALTRASRGTFILCNRRKPSRYIHELCDIAGENVRFETIDGKDLDQCPRCLVGQIVARKGQNDTTFYGCDQYPDCRYTQQTDPALEKARGPST